MIAGILLAAGASRRFGADKLLHDLEGKPLVRHSAEALAQIARDVIVVIAPGADGIRAALSGMTARLIVNPDAALGVGTSIAAGVAALPASADAALLALADTPVPSRAASRAVLERYRRGGVSIVAPRFQGVPGHPVLFARDVFPELIALDGDRGARAVIDRDPARVAIVELDEAPPTDVDVRGDLHRVRREPGR